MTNSTVSLAVPQLHLMMNRRWQRSPKAAAGQPAQRQSPRAAVVAVAEPQVRFWLAEG